MAIKAPAIRAGTARRAMGEAKRKPMTLKTPPAAIDPLRIETEKAFPSNSFL